MSASTRLGSKSASDLLSSYQASPTPVGGQAKTISGKGSIPGLGLGRPGTVRLSDPERYSGDRYGSLRSRARLTPDPFAADPYDPGREAMRQRYAAEVEAEDDDDQNPYSASPYAQSYYAPSPSKMHRRSRSHHLSASPSYYASSSNGHSPYQASSLSRARSHHLSSPSPYSPSHGSDSYSRARSPSTPIAGQDEDRGPAHVSLIEYLSARPKVLVFPQENPRRMERLPTPDQATLARLAGSQRPRTSRRGGLPSFEELEGDGRKAKGSLGGKGSLKGLTLGMGSLRKRTTTGLSLGSESESGAGSGSGMEKKSTLGKRASLSGLLGRSASVSSAGVLSKKEDERNEKEEKEDENHHGSIAVRAMKSVRSLAMLGTWGRERKDSEDKASKKHKHKKSKSRDIFSESSPYPSTETETENDTDGSALRNKESQHTLRGSVDFDRARSPTPTLKLQASSSTIGRKGSILGLGLPSSMRLPSKRNGSSASTSVVPEVRPVPILNKPGHTVRPSVDSAFVFEEGGMGRRNSQSSTSTGTSGSSLRPVSIMSATSSMRSSVSNDSRLSSNSATARLSSGNVAVLRLSTESGPGSRPSSGSSIRWDEEGLQRARSQRERESSIRRREREAASDSKTSKGSKKNKGKGEKEKKSKESKRTTQSSRRPGVMDLFPELRRRSHSPERDGGDLSRIDEDESFACVGEVSVEKEAEKGDVLVEEKVETPVKKVRVRPVSEGVIGRARPAGMVEGSNGASLLFLPASVS